MTRRAHFDSKRAERLTTDTGPIELPTVDPMSIRTHALILAPGVIALLLLGSYCVGGVY